MCCHFCPNPHVGGRFVQNCNLTICTSDFYIILCCNRLTTVFSSIAKASSCIIEPVTMIAHKNRDFCVSLFREITKKKCIFCALLALVVSTCYIFFVIAILKFCVPFCLGEAANSTEILLCLTLKYSVSCSLLKILHSAERRH